MTEFPTVGDCQVNCESKGRERVLYQHLEHLKINVSVVNQFQCFPAVFHSKMLFVFMQWCLFTFNRKSHLLLLDNKLVCKNLSFRKRSLIFKDFIVTQPKVFTVVFINKWNSDLRTQPKRCRNIVHIQILSTIRH